jgi:hypothetical protein
VDIPSKRAKVRLDSNALCLCNDSYLLHPCRCLARLIRLSILGPTLFFARRCVTLCVALDRSLLNSTAITDPSKHAHDSCQPIIPGDSIKMHTDVQFEAIPNARAIYLLVNADAPCLNHESILPYVTPLFEVSTTSLGDERNIDA